MSKAIELADEVVVLWDNGLIERDDLEECADELRRLASVEKQLEAAQAELALVNEVTAQLREQNTTVDAACAKYEAELAAILALEPVADVLISDDDFDLGLTDDYAFGKKRLPDGRHNLYALPEQKK